MPEEREASERGWPRALGLFLIAGFASPWIGGTVLVAVAYVFMVAGLPVRRSVGYLVGGIMVWAALQGDRAEMWWTARGWALLAGGWFVALTLRRPESGFFPRALAAVVGALGLAPMLLAVTGGSWHVLDWQMAEGVQTYFAEVQKGFESFSGRALPPALAETIYAVAEWQMQVFPATLALATLAALGAAWWVYVRMAHDDDRGLLPLREFRFNDHLVWLFLGGLVLTLVGGDRLGRVGTNAVVFMGGLYALRGAAVVSFFGGPQSPWRTALLVMALLIVAPMMLVVMVAALVIGLGDTWLDLRARVRAMTA